MKVEDHPTSTFVRLGVQGAVAPSRMRKAVEALRAWLEGLRAEWVEDGLPRRLGYHGPMTRREGRPWEVQLSVKAAPKSTDGTKP